MKKGGTALLVLGLGIFLAAFALPPRPMTVLFFRERLTEILKKRIPIVVWEQMPIEKIPLYLIPTQEEMRSALTLAHHSRVLRRWLWQVEAMHVVEIAGGETILVLEYPRVSLPPARATEHSHHGREFVVFYKARLPELNAAIAQELFPFEEVASLETAFSSIERRFLRIARAFGLASILAGGMLAVFSMKSSRSKEERKPVIPPTPRPQRRKRRVRFRPRLQKKGSKRTRPLHRGGQTRGKWDDLVGEIRKLTRNKHRLDQRRQLQAILAELDSSRDHPLGQAQRALFQARSLIERDNHPKQKRHTPREQNHSLLNLAQILPIERFLPPRLNADAVRAILYWGFHLGTGRPFIGNHYLTVEAMWDDTLAKVGGRYPDKMFADCFAWLVAAGIVGKRKNGAVCSINPSHRSVREPGSEIIRAIVRMRALQRRSSS